MSTRLDQWYMDEDVKLSRKSHFEIDGLILITGYVREIGKMNQRVPDDIIKLVVSYWENISIMHTWKSNRNLDTLQLLGERHQTIRIRNDTARDFTRRSYFWLEDGIRFHESSPYEYNIKFQCRKQRIWNSGVKKRRFHHICLGVGIINNGNEFIGFECCPYGDGTSGGHKLYQISHNLGIYNRYLHQGYDTKKLDDFAIKNKDILMLIVNTKLKTICLDQFQDKIKVKREWKHKLKIDDENKVFDICFRLMHINQYITIKNYSCTRL